MSRQSKNQNSNNNISLIVKAAIAAAVIIILGFIAIAVNTYHNQQIQEVQQEQLVKQKAEQKKKEQPEFKKYENENKDSDIENLADELTKKQLLQHIKVDLSYGFSLITDKSVLSIITLTKKDFLPQEYKKFQKYFGNLKAFTDFNQAVNVSTVSGRNYYGQNGKYKVYKTSTQGDSYSLVDAKIGNAGSNYANRIYDVLLIYKAGKYANKRFLSIEVDKTTGVISSVKNEGTNNEQ